MDHYPEYKRFRIEVTESNVNAKRLYESAGASDSRNITRWCWIDKIEAAEEVYDNLRMSMKATS